jgi:hypothetical protein
VATYPDLLELLLVVVVVVDVYKSGKPFGLVGDGVGALDYGGATRHGWPI